MGIAAPFSLEDLVLGLALLIAILVGAVFYFFGVRRSVEARVVIAALVAKLAACLIYSFLIVRVMGGGDSLGYHRDGVLLAQTLRNDLLWGSDRYLQSEPFFLPAGSSTAHMQSLSGLVHFLVFDSFLASSVVFAVLGFAGQLLTYRTFVERYPDPRLRIWWRAGILFFPTITFWSAGLLKDAVGMWGLGLALWGIHRVLTRPRPAAFLVFLVGVYTLILFRMQVVPVLCLALVPWVMQSQRMRTRLREWSSRRPRNPLLRVALVAGVIAGVWLAGKLEPRFTLAALPLAIASQSEVYERIGGAHLEAISAPTWSSLLAAAPVALVVSLFRPFVWEAPGVLGILASLENLVLFLLVIRTVVRIRRHRGTLRSIVRAPMFLTCCIFVVLFGIAVGASTPNLGTVSRYRIPLLPFFIGMLAIAEHQVMELQRRGRPWAIREHGAAA